MNDREFDALLESAAPELPPDDVARDVTPWRRAIGNILGGSAMCSITLNFFCLNYLLPTIGVILQLLGFRPLRRENGWFRACWLLAVLRAALFLPCIVLNATIYSNAVYASSVGTALTYGTVAAQLLLFFCFWRALRAVQQKAGAEVRVGSAAALLIWYAAVLALAYVQYSGLLLGLAMLGCYILILRSLFRLSREMEESGYALTPAPVRLSDEMLVRVIAALLAVGIACGYLFFGSYRMDVTFVLCNTDNQALAESPVPVKLQLGRSITQGLGAGNRPERARDAAEESIEDIKAQLNDGTKMVFITAGMGGGTGTGAAPVIARIAKEMDILTVGIVTIPFIFEGEKKIIQALDGVERIAQHVDALLVINNERLREIYADLTFMNAFGKADDTLSIAAKSIAEIITMRGTVNLDFADVKTILKDGGVAIMSTGFGEGENRVTKAIDDALHSPLLNNNDIFNAKKVMLNVSFCPSSELMMEEMNEIHEFMSKFREGVEVIWGVAIDNSLDTKVKITVLATGFGVEDVPGMDSLHAARSQEEEERQLQLEEEKEKNKERIRKAYGESASNIGSKSLRKRRHIYLFNTEDLDNDDIIAMVEDSPTYMRDKTTLTKIRTKAALEEEVATEEATDDNGVITF